MPLLLDRRRFLKSTAAGLALCKAGPAVESVRLALISDTHISADPSDTTAAFRSIRI